MFGPVAAKVYADAHPPRVQRLVHRPEKTPISGGKAVGQQAVDHAVGGHPLPQDKAVIVDRAGVFFFQIGHELGRKCRVIVDGIRLTVDVSVTVQKLLEPVSGAFRVAGAVKMGVGAGKAAFQHLEHALVPSGDLVTVDILKGSALDAGDVLFVVGTEDIDLFAEQLHHVACCRGADHTYKVGAPELPHQGQHIALQCAQGVAHEHQQALAPGRADPLRDGHSAVQVGLAASGGSGLDVPPVGTVAQVLLLKLSQWHCPHLPAAPWPLPEHPRPGPPARLPPPASSAARRRPEGCPAWPALQCP